jgi:ankyrin repeat protein
VGLRLLAAGADPCARGLFGATALHWAARLGQPTLVEALIVAGADIDLKDATYASSTLGWAVHARATKSHEDRGDPLACVRLLVAAGATVEPRWLASDAVKADAALLAAQSSHPASGT